jgi:hypothetical protein
MRELLPGLVIFRLVTPPLQPRVVSHIQYGVYGSSAICRWRYPTVSRILGRNQRLTVPGVLDPDSSPQAVR